MIRPGAREKIEWVERRLVVEIRFKDWSETAHLRDPTFLAVRCDRTAEKVVREA